jgi:hypothetical protein
MLLTTAMFTTSAAVYLVRLVLASRRSGGVSSLLDTAQGTLPE